MRINLMHCTVTYDKENDYVVASCEGVLNIEAMSEIARKIVEKAKEHGCKKLLNDLRKVKLEVDTMEIFKSPDTLQEQGIDRNMMRAVVVDEKHEGDFHFFETVAVNRGHLMRVFTDYNSAITWLKNS
jgi:hypothetical protein